MTINQTTFVRLVGTVQASKYMNTLTGLIPYTLVQGYEETSRGLTSGNRKTFVLSEAINAVEYYLVREDLYAGARHSLPHKRRLLKLLKEIK